MSLNNYYSGYTRESVDVSKLKKVVRDKDMDSLLYDLLTIVSPHGKETMIPMQVFTCAKCGHINEDFQTKE